jgi:glucose/mannose-6-phosphate isomerase
MMSDAIQSFASQFAWQPEIINGEKLPKKIEQFIVLGMGGSHLAADIIAGIRPQLPVIVHSDYGLPAGDLSDTLVIASSHSGNTEEVIDGLQAALRKKLPCAVIATGGELIAIAQKKKLPYVQMPNDGIQPRSALGHSVLATLTIMGQEKELRQVSSLAKTLNAAQLRSAGTALAKKIQGRVPVIYASNRNRAVAYNWKIKFNETGKIPAFYNVLPELNHNEMTGFDAQKESKKLAESFHFILLADERDHPRVQKRMQLIEKLYKKRGLAVTVKPLTGGNSYEAVFTSLLLADWTAVAMADLYGLESEAVPMVEEFKELMRK